MKKLLTTLSLVILVVACTPVGPDYAPPRTNLPGGWKAFVETAREAKLAGWWKKFDDKTLNKLIDMAFTQSLDTQAAIARLKQVRATYGTSNADLWPTLDLSGSARRVGLSKNAGLAVSGTNYNTYATGFDSSWEIDFFGGNRRALEAAKADVEAEQEDLRNVATSVLAEVAINYIQLRTYQEHLRIARKNIELQFNTHQLVAAKAENGLNSELEELMSRIKLDNVRASIPDIKTNITAAKNRITALVGKKPGELDTLLDTESTIPSSDIRLVIGIPADMIRSRPDVNKAERELAAATARIGMKKSELYPKLSLGGSIGLESLQKGSLFEQASNTFGLSSVIVWNVFDTGRIRNEILFQQMKEEEAYINYHASVINALEETENAITAYVNESLRVHSFESATKAATKASEISASKHENGLINIAQLAETQQAQLEAERTLATSKGNAAANLVRLYKALGGGWETFGQQ